MATIRTALSGAGRIFVPPPGDRHGPLVPLLVSLTVVTGLVDAYSYLVLGHVFVANMTGNVVFLALALAAAKGFSIAGSLLAIAGFALGAAAGGALIGKLGDHRGRLLSGGTTIQTLLLALCLVLALVARPSGEGDHYALIGVMATAMGLQNAVARRLAVPDLTTTVLTLTITGLAVDAGTTAGSALHQGRRVVSATAMFLGALVGAAFVVHGHGSVVLAGACACLGVVAASTVLVSRGDAPWIRPA
jgi:uncharacterized membrane protein YoaK (UPF0700 family)